MDDKKQNVLCQIGSVTGMRMMGYVIGTSDGKLIVIDGGMKEDAQHLLGCIRKVAGNENPTVDGWFLTHGHYDHIDAFKDLISNGEIRVGKVYFNFPSCQFFERNEKKRADTVAEFYALLPKFADRAVIISDGDRYRIGEATFDILAVNSHDFSGNSVNSSSSVIRMTLGGQSVLFLGDLGADAGRKLAERYGESLKSDFCQMAHHGQGGVPEDVYRVIAPRACLWCCPEWLWNNDNGDGFNTYVWQTVTVRSWMEKLGVKHHFVEKDGDIFITLPFDFEV